VDKDVLWLDVQGAWIELSTDLRITSLSSKLPWTGHGIERPEKEWLAGFEIVKGELSIPCKLLSKLLIKLDDCSMPKGCVICKELLDMCHGTTSPPSFPSPTPPDPICCRRDNGPISELPTETELTARACHYHCPEICYEFDMQKL